MSSSRLLALGAAVASFGLLACASSPVALKRTVGIGGVTARLHVPERFEPLAPGSVYPNRRMPVPAAGRPGVLLWPDEEGGGPLPSLAVRFLAERGLVVLELPRNGPAGDPAGALREAVAAFAAFRESRGGPVALLAIRPAPALVEAALDEPALRAAAFLGLDPPAGPSRRERRRLPVLVANLHEAGDEGLPERLASALGGAPVERRYLPARDGAGFPPEAARDAAEWLAGILDEDAPGR